MNRIELEQLLASGDKAKLDHALEPVIQKMKTTFFGYIKKNHNKQISDAEQEDLLHDSLTVFLKKLNTKGANIIHLSVEAYIMEIGKNKLKEFFTKKTNYYNRLNKWLNDTNVVQEDDDDENKEALIKRLIVKFESLGGACKQLLQLKYWDGKKHSEILQEMPELGNENNCKQRLHYCLSQLRKIMKD
jgi:DNA-directed RNA polymerase specialized sigma24 family protein